MRTREAGLGRAKPVNVRMREEVRSIIDRAAQIRGKNRSEFMIEASLAAAEEALLDQTLVKVDAASYRRFLDILDQPPSSEGFARLMSVPRPWEP